MKTRFPATPVVLGLSLCVIFPLFFVGGPDWASGPLYRSAWNLGHLLFFGLVVFTWQVVFGIGGWRQWLLLSAAIFIVGAIVELIQNGLGRALDWQDVVRNMLGAWLVMAWHQPSRGAGRWLPAAVLWPLRALVTVLLLFQVVPVIEIGFQQYRMARQLPMVFDIGQPQAVRYWSGDVARVPSPGEVSGQTLEIRMGTAKYSGAFLDNMPGDWQGYQQLVFEFYNPDTLPLEMTLRINDSVHDRGDNAHNDRFNRRFVAEPGWNTYRVELSEVESAPATRLMDMADVRRLGFFATGLTAPRSVYLSSLRLSGAGVNNASTE
ncbi:succinyl-CoA synthetase subunit beta [Marinobacter changyiensis]|uniref:succinyl-CoA synthetase subunit beta n=1 Tax=Marinobacter changyiensis TaxID=2604091 RepID=UPI0012640AD6|nr:succinyl-CoA synthetase subunit beta [Marinobacter changyiensis]